MTAKLRNALTLDYPSDLLDIVVASDGSQDQTNDVVRAFAPRVRLLAFANRRGKIATISDGIRSVTSDIVVFSDANTFLQPGSIRALVRNFNDPQVGAASEGSHRVAVHRHRDALAFQDVAGAGLERVAVVGGEGSLERGHARGVGVGGFG